MVTIPACLHSRGKRTPLGPPSIPCLQASLYPLPNVLLLHHLFIAAILFWRLLLHRRPYLDSFGLPAVHVVFTSCIPVL